MKTVSPKEKTVKEDFDSEVLITDTDLLQQWENAQGFELKLKRKVQERLQKVQAERNETIERRSAMTPIQRRIDQTRENVRQNLIEHEDIHHVHSGLALCGLPYKRPPDDMRDYERQYGRMSLNIESGKLTDPHTGKLIRQGLPYGPKARLIQLHICTRALRQKSPEVEIEGSMSEFIRSLGFTLTGGKNGTIALFKEQLNRLAASRMQIGLWDGKNHAKTINLSPIESMEVWFPNNPDQQMLWPSKVVLSQKFYDSLVQHALPVNIQFLSALSHSARQMDMLMWLGYRLASLKESYFLTWDILKEQFCQSEDRRMILFQKQFKEDLEEIQNLFRRENERYEASKGLPIFLNDKGLTLKICSPERLLVPPKNFLKKK